MTAHSILPPSGAGAWRKCPAWVSMNRDYPQSDSQASIEGTAAHWVFAQMLDRTIVTEGQLAPNGGVVTGEMIDGGQLLFDTVGARLSSNVYVEEFVRIPAIHPECFGTPDVWGLNAQGDLEIIDYKFGHGFVDEYENDQCIAYAAGILDEIKADVEWIHLTIVQPRCFCKGEPVRTWSVSRDELERHVVELKAAATLALSEEPPAITNVYCKHCPGRHVCPALQLSAYAAAEFTVTASPLDMGPTASGLELKFLERALAQLSARVEGMRGAVLAHIKHGELMPWYHTEQSYGRQTWSLPDLEVIAIGAMYGVDLKKVSVITPKQAEKLIDRDVIVAYSATSPGGLKLVADNPKHVLRVFK